MAATAKRLDEIHPGEIPRDEFLQPMGISVRRLAADTGVSPSRITEVLNGRRPLTADTALRLGLYFGMVPRFWLNVQAEFDMRLAIRTAWRRLARQVRGLQPAA